LVPEDASNKHFALLDFPFEYTREVEQLIYPPWYAACFMEDCRDSSIWAAYGENHRGVCLKFKVDNADGSLCIPLKRIAGLNSGGPTIGRVQSRFEKVKYRRSKLESVDFFRSLGQNSMPDLRRNWYSDENGNESPIGKIILSDSKSWHKKYRSAFHKSIHSKSSAWKKEREYRLILTGEFVDYSNAENRKAQYDFSSLDGIIFGIQTCMRDKLAISRIIEEKCRAEGRSDFKFYQAHADHKTGKIEHHELSLLKFV